MLLTAGIITFNDEQYLESCLETLTTQTGLGNLGTDWQIVIWDNASQNRSYLTTAKKRYPQITIVEGGLNVGFAKAHNEIIRTFPAKYHAVLNNDILFARDYLAQLIQTLEKDDTCGSATGKLLRWDREGVTKQTNIIDSTGITATTNLAFLDRGQGEKDTGQYNAQEKCFGASGAAALYRRSDLEKIAYNTNEFFDETMFMYKEDCDLALRFLAINKPCVYIPAARAWHDRTASSVIKRKERSQSERLMSAAHQSIIIQKHKKWFPIAIYKNIVLREWKRWSYLFCCESSTFFGARKLLRSLRKEIQLRKRQTKHSITFSEIRHFFSA